MAPIESELLQNKVQGAIFVMNEIWNDEKLKITSNVIY